MEAGGMETLEANGPVVLAYEVVDNKETSLLKMWRQD